MGALPRSRSYKTRWIISCRFPDGSIQYPTGHGADENGMMKMLFSSSKDDALHSQTHDGVCAGWVYLLSQHAKRTGIRFSGYVHQAHQQPQWEHTHETTH